MAKHIVIDCDTGIDDAIAITVALCWQGVKVEAITCVAGNTSLSYVLRNTLSVIKANNRTVPVYAGCPTSLLRRKHADKNTAADSHGEDGFGNANIDVTEEDRKMVQKEHAAVALCRLARENKKKLTLVTLAPLTNIAMAMRLDPEFTENLAEIAIMGGNYLGPGTEAGGAEFNFFMDTDAADIVLREANCPITVVPFDCCEISSAIPWAWINERISRPNLAPQGRLIGSLMNAFSATLPFFTAFDALAMIVALDKTAIESADEHEYLTVDPETGFFLHGDIIPASKTGNRVVVKTIKTDEIKRRIESALFY